MWCTCNPQVYRGSQWDTSQCSSYYKEGFDPPEHLHAFFFLEIIQLLVVETNRYYHQYLDSLTDRQSPLPDVTLKEMYSFLALILQMGHDIRDTLKHTGLQQNSSVCPFLER